MKSSSSIQPSKAKYIPFIEFLQTSGKVTRGLTSHGSSPSIGPYHHGKPNLRAMEEHKWRYLHSLLARTTHGDSTEARLKACIEKVRGSETRARSCYSERVDLGTDDFVEMMVLDGCFILQLFLALLRKGKNKDDPIWSVAWMTSVIWCDLLKLENQIPFFILEDLFSVASDTCSSLKNLALKFVMPPRSPEEQLRFNLDGVEVCHLLHFYDLVLHPTLVVEKPNTSVRTTPSPTQSIIMKMNPFGSSSRIRHLPTVKSEGRHWSKIPCAVELREAGIKLRKKPTANTWLDVTFSDGTLHIPFVSIHHMTNPTFRNLVAFEQCRPNAGDHFTTYVLFLDCIIDTSRDVAILRRRGIIGSDLGSHEEVAQLINQLCKEVTLDVPKQYLAKLFEEVNQYCESRWHKHRAMLRHTYFSNPWAIISVVVATSFLFMTLIQVIYAVLSYQKQQN